MGTTAGVGTTAVDPLALSVAAERLEAAADILHTALRTQLAGLRSYPSVADPVADLVADLVADVARWEAGARELAVALRTAADRYLESEARAAAALR